MGRRESYAARTGMTVAEVADYLGVSKRTVEGDWAELNAPNDLSHFILGTKAETLDRLRPLVTRSTIDAQITISYHEWVSDRSAAIQRITVLT